MIRLSVLLKGVMEYCMEAAKWTSHLHLCPYVCTFPCVPLRIGIVVVVSLVFGVLDTGSQIVATHVLAHIIRLIESFLSS